VAARFPFSSFPRGWFVIGFPSDVAPGEVKTVHYFGQDIVLFRSEAGALSAFDKTCPHLGAHLGGGKVEGGCLRCPFHGWAFDGDGRCVDVPYAPKVPPKAAVRAWQVREHNGVILAWYCPKGEPPTWEPAPLDEEGWMPNRVIRWEIRSHPQEIGENTVDITHLGPVHHAISGEVISLEQSGHHAHILLRMVVTGAPIQMPDEINDVELDVSMDGLGLIVSTTHVVTAGLHTRQRIYPTPVDAERCAIYGVNNIKAMPDPGYTKEIDEIFYQAFITDFPRDFPIWENKAYMDRPLLAGGDGPIGRYRRWARQFYDGPKDEAAAPEPVASSQPERKTVLDRITRWARRLPTVGPLAASLSSKLGARLGGGGSNGAVHEPEPDEPVGGKLEGRAPAPRATQRFGSVDAYFKSLEARFDPTAAGDIDAVFQWVLTGDDARAHFVEIKAGSAQASAGTHPAPTVAIEMAADDYLRLINGELNGAMAFSTGRGKLRGPVRLAMKMQRIFPLDRAV
jgi:nitrite reductase/ring-hydroxylating ferredoxin subunit/putative sterol carrier protein